jgi:hypothetical protein
MTLARIVTCTFAELRAFSQEFDYFRLVLEGRDLLGDELLATHLRFAGAARDGREGYEYLVNAGRELARLLAMDLPRLDAILRRIRP